MSWDRVSPQTYFYIVCLRWSCALVSQAGVQWRDLSSSQPPPPGSSDSLASASRGPLQAGATTNPANFVFLVETGLLRVGQAGLELLTSVDLLPRPPGVLGLQV